LWRGSAYVRLIYVTEAKLDDQARDGARAKLLEAEEAYQRARADDYVSRLIRDSAMVEAHRAGLSSREIGELLGGLGQPNVVRARRRAETHREVVPDGLLSPADAVRESGLGPRQFLAAVREGRVRPVEVNPGVHAFRPEEVRHLAATGRGR
jgi:hypothetical protein